MNDERRKRIREAIAQIEAGRQDLEQVRDEEQEYYDNIPENLQQGEKAEKAQEAIDALTAAIDEIENGVSNLDDVS